MRPLLEASALPSVPAATQGRTPALLAGWPEVPELKEPELALPPAPASLAPCVTLGPGVAEGQARLVTGIGVGRLLPKEGPPGARLARCRHLLGPEPAAQGVVARPAALDPGLASGADGRLRAADGGEQGRVQRRLRQEDPGPAVQAGGGEGLRGGRHPGGEGDADVLRGDVLQGPGARGQQPRAPVPPEGAAGWSR